MVASAEVPVVPRLTSSVKDTTVSGLEGLNLNLEVPFSYQDYVVGLKYSIGSDLKKLPNLFAKKSFDTPADGRITFNTDFTPADNNLNVDAQWESDSLGVSASASIDTKNRLKSVGLIKKFTAPRDLDVILKSKYNVLKNKFCGSAKVSDAATSLEIACDSVDVDPRLTITRAIDRNHDISPSITLRTGL